MTWLALELAVAMVCLASGLAYGDDAPAPEPDVSATEEPGEIIVVTGTRSERPVTATTTAGEVVTRDQLERSGGRTIADVLATRAGVWVERTLGRASVSLQNLGPEYTLILVDGQRQVGRVDGVLDLDRITTDGVERIEIVRGAGSALYGSDALGGIVNVITADPDDRYAELGVRHDSNRATDVSARAGDGRRRLRWQLGAGAARSDGYDRDAGDLSTTASAFTEWRADGRAVWVPGDDGRRIALAGDYARRDLRGVDASATGAVLDRRNLVESGSVRLLARWPVSDSTLVRGSASATELRDQFLSDQRNSDALDDYQESIDRAAEASVQVERRFGARNLITAGLDAMAEHLRSPRLDDGDGGRARAAVFVQDEPRLGRDHQILLVPAVRLDADSQFGVHPSPKLGARWGVSDRIAIRASYGWGYRAPDFKQLYLRFENPGVGYVVEGDPGFAPETSQTIGAGVDLHVESLDVTLDAYRTDLSDMIGFVLDQGSAMPMRFVYANIAAAHVQGVDVAAGWGRGRLRAQLTYSLSLTADEDLDRPLDGRPRHRGAVELVWTDDAEGFVANARAVATGRRSYFADLDGDGVDDERIAGRFVTIGAQLAKRFTRGTRCYLGIDNLLDAGDAELTPIAPRTLYVGVEVRR